MNAKVNTLVFGFWRFYKTLVCSAGVASMVEITKNAKTNTAI